MKKWKYVVLVVVALFGLFAATRITPFATYLPFSGKIFCVDAEDTDMIFVQNGTTGEQHFFETAEERAHIAQQLESIRYRSGFRSSRLLRVDGAGGLSWNRTGRIAPTTSEKIILQSMALCTSFRRNNWTSCGPMWNHSTEGT